LADANSTTVIDRDLIDRASEDLDVPHGIDEKRPVASTALAAMAFVLLMLVGAAASAWVFSDAIARMVAEWQATPPPPAAPSPRLPVPLAPVRVPDATPER
jgi:hypothetical protein